MNTLWSFFFYYYYYFIFIYLFILVEYYAVGQIAWRVLCSPVNVKSFRIWRRDRARRSMIFWDTTCSLFAYNFRIPVESLSFLCLFYTVGRVKRICVFEHSVMTNFNCACPAIQKGQGSGFLSEGSSWLTACMLVNLSAKRMRRLAWTFAARIGDNYQIRLTRPTVINAFLRLLLLYVWV